MASYSSSSSRTRSKTPSSTSSPRLDFAEILGSNFLNSIESGSTNQNMLQVHGELKPTERNSTGDYIMEIEQENQALRRELDIKEGTLQNNMHAIKNFWSPELKNERTMRKEESTRAAILREKLKCSQDENQSLQLEVQALQDEVRAQQDLNQLLQDDMSGSQAKDLNLQAGGYAVDTRILQEEVDRLSRENELLQRTMEEMEIRIETQKQTLDTRDESISKLLDLLQSKTFTEDTDNEVDSLKMQLVEATARLAQLDSLLTQRNCEIIDLKKEISTSAYPNELPTIQSLQAVINMKDGKLAILERDLNRLEEEKVRRGGNNANEEREEELKQLDVLKSHSSFMKNKLEQLKCDLQKKDTLLATMQTKLDTLNNQQSDSRQHIDVLKESLAAKEQRAVVLQAEVDSLRTRLDEKQQILDRKQEQLSVMQEQRSTSGSQVTHLQDTLDVKNRKLIVLQRKIESLGDVVKEKDRQLEVIKERLLNIRKDSSTNESALNAMEEALTEKEKVIKRLQSELKSGEEKWKSQLERFQQEQKNLIINCNTLKEDMKEKDVALADMKEHASSLASASLKKESQLKQMEITIQQLREKLTQSEELIKKVEDDHKSASMQAEVESNRVKVQNEDKLIKAEAVAKEKEEEVKKCQNDLERLLKILTETENEKHEKDKRLIALERQAKDQQERIKGLQNKMAEDVKLKSAAHTKDATEFLTQIKKKDQRIEELEEALRQSVQITAEREDVLSKEQQNIRKLRLEQDEVNKQVKNGQLAIEKSRSQLSCAEQMLHDREKTIRSLLIERKKHMQELLDLKQESLLSAISEKDANIALLELSASKKRANQEEVQSLKKEKDHLMNQLKQQTQNSLKLMQDGYFDSTPLSQHQPPPSPQQKRRSHNSPNSRHENPNGGHSPNEDEEGIWA